VATANILNYDLAPSPATIFGCLLPAPWLGAAAGLLLAFGPAEGLPDRFAPLTLALTHWLALGLLAPVMIGALFQLMPVVAGQTVPAARFVSPFVAAGSAVIALGLAAGFLMGEPLGFRVAAALAALLYGSVVLALAWAAWRVQVTDATTRTLRWVPLAIGAVATLGAGMAGALGGWWQLDLQYWLNLHAAWAVVGWVGALLLGVASTVVPMFWQTERPTSRWQGALPALVWAPLLLASSSALLWPVGVTLGCLVVVGFGAVALRALRGAKRHFDPAWVLWLACASSWIAAASLTLLLTLSGESLPAPLRAMLPWWIGVAALVGGAVLPLNAMLGKIIPFLVFLHLRRQIPAGTRVPTMQAVLPPVRLKWQARLVLSAYLLLLALPLAPQMLALPAGLAFAASQATMGALLMLTLFRYRRELIPVLLARRTQNTKKP
jgi:hypothetical protein